MDLLRLQCLRLATSQTSKVERESDRDSSSKGNSKRSSKTRPPVASLVLVKVGCTHCVFEADLVQSMLRSPITKLGMHHVARSATRRIRLLLLQTDRKVETFPLFH
jgi:hypothetical protein